MKAFTFLFLFTLLCVGILHAQQTYSQQDLTGAWEIAYVDDGGKQVQAVVIAAGGFYSLVFFDGEDHSFLATRGGLFRVDGNKMYLGYEFHTEMPEMVGKEEGFEIVSLQDDVLTLGENGGSWKRVDDGTPGQLAGAWLISGRMREGEIRRRSTDGPRKTMKILSGTRFQWIAYNTETKEFMGTGGGTYTTEEGAYVETIDVFSRDVSRVGAELPFEFELIDGEWHHKGLSSKGQPIHEVWTMRK